METYFDRRADFWREHFDLAMGYDDFLAAAGSGIAANWITTGDSLPPLPPADRQRLSGHHRTLKVLVYAGIRCGDCARQGPILKAICEAVGDNVELRLIARDTSEPLKDELRIIGAMRIPVVVFLSEDYHEVGRFGDRMLSTYRLKVERETGEACAAGIIPPSSQELVTEMGEWADIFERMLLMLRLSPPLRDRYND
jgi:hypothetical protein